MSGGGEGYCLSHLLWQLPSSPEDGLHHHSNSTDSFTFSAEELLRR
eukprot:CAMPEP_0194386256 /NCGR_PEP_ID=MMETSP0174-20130528/85288_1 /TAXON_ID=216777 /ORGANISM="Proboscia alata, Strain PI-D3" /LENGTH=45 /DNA_ID= /DNA_START= /DNA_END= /DNA_ORIENTATION=